MKLPQLLILAILLAAACKNKPERPETLGDVPTDSVADTAAVAEISIDTAIYTINSYDKKNDDCKGDTSNCATFKASFPIVQKTNNNPFADSINNFIRQNLYSPLFGDKPANGLNDLLAPYFEAFKQSLQNDEEYQSASGWYYERNFLVSVNTPQLFTIGWQQSAFAGGAHPNRFINYYNFDPKTGKQMWLSDFLTLGSEKIMRRMGEIKFRKMKRLSERADLEDAGYRFIDNKFHLNENFVFTPKGIKFTYNTYEIASYAEGTTELFFDFKEMANLLKNEYKPLNRDVIN